MSLPTQSITDNDIMCPFASVKKIYKAAVVRRVSVKRVSSLHDWLEASQNCRRKRTRRWRWAALVLALTTVYYLFGSFKPNPPSFKAEAPLIVSTDYGEKSERLIGTQAPNNKTTTGTLLRIVRQKSDVNVETKEISSFNSTEDPNIKKTHCILSKPSDKRLDVKRLPNNVSLETLYPTVKNGGYYHPPDCSPTQRVGILVPYREREASLIVFLYNIHPFLVKQKLEYQIFVIEQDGYHQFNKGRLLNAGFKEMLKFRSFDCVVIHDVDLIPLDERILYSCPSFPRHMSSKIRDEDLKALNKTSIDALFGGVVSMTVEQYKRANGYSNMYFGWGAEDNDMFFRLRAAGYPIVKYNKTIAVYAMLPHKRPKENTDRFFLLSTGLERYKRDGLSNIEYSVLSTDVLRLYTRLLVDIILPTDVGVTLV